MLVRMNVLSFCHYLQGPACTQYLADMGADVIKVEPPSGAFERHWSGGESYVGGVSAFLMCANRNKRSIAVDLKKPAAREIMDRLVDWTDVVVENFRPGVMERLGLGYPVLHERKPEIIYASATGLGAAGPMKDRPGQDLLMQARSGLMAVTANHETGPVAVGAAIVDQHGGALLAMGILAAYVRRLQTGVGTRVEGTLLNAGIDLQTEALTKYFARTVKGDVLTRDLRVGSWYHHAPYGVYPVADGHVALSMNDAARMAEALDSDALRALSRIDRYAERDRYARAVAREIEGRPFAELAAAFDAHGVWFERVQDYDALRADPQVVYNECFREVPVGDRTATLVNHPLRYDGELPGYEGMPFAVGAHSREILAELGYDEDRIEDLVTQEVIVVGRNPAKVSAADPR